MVNARKSHAAHPGLDGEQGDKLSKRRPTERAACLRLTAGTTLMV